MKKSFCRFISVLCAAAIAMSCFTGCGNTDAEDTAAVDVQEPDMSWQDDVSSKTGDPNAVVLSDYSGGDTLTVWVDGEVSSLNPFFAESEAEITVADLFIVKLLETDRNGYVVQNGVDGAGYTYNGTEYTYTGIANVEISGNRLVFTLNEDVYFSDGVNLTADDVIFTMYVLADPSYDGDSTFASLPIEGIEEYRGKMEQKWKIILNDIITGSQSGGYTEEEKESFELAFKQAGLVFTEEIVSGCVELFADDYSDFVLGVSADELSENHGLQVAFSQYFWDYSTGYGEDGLWYDISGNSYDLKETFPTTEDYWQLIFDNYGYDISNDGINYEKIGDRDFEDILVEVINNNYPELMVSAQDDNSANTISGIEKTDMYSFTVTFTELAPEYLNAFCFYVAPLHYYGSRDNYKYSEGRFGFVKGDLSSVKAKSDVPLGAGAYAYSGVEENGDILLCRNMLYYKGCPNITNVIITTDETNADLVYKEYTGEAAYSGNYAEVQSDTYVTIGINAEAVSVGGEPLSDASVSLRNAFAIVFEAYREIAVEQWENTGVHSVTDDTAWADDLDSVTRNARIEAISYFKEAGYIWDNEQEKFTEAPEGASMSYEIMLYTYDAAYIVLNYAKELFADIGITLTISVQTTRESLENHIQAGEAQMWVLKIEGSTYSDVHSMFHSEGENNIYGISAEEIDEKIEWAKGLYLKNVRAAAYSDIFEMVIGYGVFVPVYKQIDAVIYSDDIVPESMAADMTAYWTWLNEVHLLKMK